MQNIKFQELLGTNAVGINYAVTSNWRIDFSQSAEFRSLIEDGTAIEQMSFACHSDFDFTTEIEYADASIKGIPIHQAAWQTRTIENQECAVYERMDHRVFKALVKATNKTAGFLEHRNIAEKTEYTFNNVYVYALGNSSTDGDVPTSAAYRLIGCQVLSCKSPTYTSDSADIADVTLTLYAHGWELSGDEG